MSAVQHNEKQVSAGVVLFLSLLLQVKTGHCVSFPLGVEKAIESAPATRECAIFSFMLTNSLFKTTVTVHHILLLVASPALPLMAVLQLPMHLSLTS